MPVSSGPADVPLPFVSEQPEEDINDGLLTMACAACAGESVESNWIILKQDLDRINGCPFCLRELTVEPIPKGELKVEEVGADEAKYHKRIG